MVFTCLVTHHPPRRGKLLPRISRFTSRITLALASKTMLQSVRSLACAPTAFDQVTEEVVAEAGCSAGLGIDITCASCIRPEVRDWGSDTELTSFQHSLGNQS